jgi:hypothetical protein
MKHVSVGLALFWQSHYWSLRSAADSVLLPKPKPRAMREHFVVPSIRRRDVACAEWPNIRCFEHFLQLLDVVNDAFNVHPAPNIQHKHGNGQTGRHQ